MKKWMTIGIGIAAMLLAACGGKAASEVNTRELAATLATELSYDEALEEIPVEDISIYMDVADGAEGVFYKGGGSTAEEVAVFACEDEDSAQATYGNLEKLLAEQESSFEAYDPEEVARLKNAYLEQRGNYVILCVNSDADAAKGIVDQAFGQ